MKKNQDNIVSYKVVLIGDSAVGKTSLIRLYNYKDIDKCHIPTLACDYFITNENVEGKQVKLLVWDTAGQERFRSISTNYVKNARGILLVYSVTDRNSFNNVSRWLDDIVNVIDDFLMILIGNKTDLEEERTVSFEEGKKLANDYRVPFFETSIYQDKMPEHAMNISDIFHKLAKDIYQTDKERGVLEKKADPGFTVDENNQNQGGCGC